MDEVLTAHHQEDIISLGWIHTHPAYSVFLSSIDLHNQYQRQLLLPEMVATVCSIKDNEFRKVINKKQKFIKFTLSGNLRFKQSFKFLIMFNILSCILKT